MKAIVWHGKEDVRCDNVPDPKIEDQRNLIIKVTSTAICGSDLHLYDLYVPAMMPGDVLGHEPMGEVVEVGSQVTKFKKGDKVVVPFTIVCGQCWFCQKQFYSCCDTTNRDKEKAAAMMGHAPAGLYGYSHLTGAYQGGQAQYLQVWHADASVVKVPNEIPDEKVLFLSDAFPTGYFAAEQAGIEPGDTVAVWGCGPVGQFAIRSAWMLGAGRVIAIDNVPERLQMARDGKAETVNFEEVTVYDRLQEMTKGRGADRVIDAVGCEAHYAGYIDAVLDKAKTLVGQPVDRAHALREAIMCCRKAGTVSVVGVYANFPDKFPMGAFMNKGLQMRAAQTHMQRLTQPLLDKVLKGEFDPSFVITHRLPIEEGPAAYRTFRDKKDNCIKVVLKPWAN
ncbi:zinc-dependent alcohol dehydrogenase [Gemmata sp.]|uniref:zinc-dependent alcohol dehydrogenase n=1 Tax=Gemmata sp. TaxID=1914242 RepID=UPI003F715E67